MRRGRGYMLVDVLAGLAILCGVVLAMVVAQSRAAEAVAAEAQRAAAAARLEELLDGVRAGAVAIMLNGETRIGTPNDDVSGRAMGRVIAASPWPGDGEITKVTITVCWRSVYRREASLSAETLVRTSRLKTAGGAP